MWSKCGEGSVGEQVRERTGCDQGEREGVFKGGRKGVVAWIVCGRRRERERETVIAGED